MKADIMEKNAFTTSFGRRAASLGQVAAQLQVRRALEDSAQPGSNAPAAVNKWAMFRTLTEARERLGVSDRALSVLQALLSFHPEVALSLPRRPADGEPGAEASASCDLIVFPSNKALALRAHGMASMTLWRHLKALTEAGLILRRDSPNGKRYARKDASGQERYADAFGFDLTPLVVRAAEFEALAEEVRAAARRRALVKERVSLLRRDVTKLIGLGLDEGLPGDWVALRARALTLMTPLRRLRASEELAALEAALADVRGEAAKLLETHLNVVNSMSNDHHSDGHQSNSNAKWTSDFEPASKEVGPESAPSAAMAEPSGAEDGPDQGGAPCPLGLALEACPDLKDYGPGGGIRTWADFRAAAAAVRPMIGISPDAWAEAQAALGATEAHVVVAAILQRSIHSSEAQSSQAQGGGAITVNGSPAIRSAGGYLRALTEEARAGDFALGPILMALIGQRLKARAGARQGGAEGRAGPSPSSVSRAPGLKGPA
jgi:replication initiation protein RepC